MVFIDVGRSQNNNMNQNFRSRESKFYFMR